MIILETEFGCTFVNERSIDIAEHDITASTVYIEGRREGYKRTYKKVVQMIYTSDSQPGEYKDAGSEIKKIKEEKKRLNEEIAKYKVKFLKAKEDLFELSCAVSILSEEKKADIRWCAEKAEALRQKCLRNFEEQSEE